MKKFLVVILLAGAAYLVFSGHGGPGKPVYAEFRVKQADTGIELVGLGKMTSESECQARSSEFWGNIFSSGQRFSIVSAQCVPEIPSRYRDLFTNKAIHATYLSFEKGNDSERDGRFIIYGVSSSDVARVCPEIVQRFKQNYSGKVECVRGTVG